MTRDEMMLLPSGIMPDPPPIDPRTGIPMAGLVSHKAVAILATDGAWLAHAIRAEVDAVPAISRSSDQLGSGTALFTRMSTPAVLRAGANKRASPSPGARLTWPLERREAICQGQLGLSGSARCDAFCRHRDRGPRSDSA